MGGEHCTVHEYYPHPVETNFKKNVNKSRMCYWERFHSLQSTTNILKSTA